MLGIVEGRGWLDSDISSSLTTSLKIGGLNIPLGENELLVDLLWAVTQQLPGVCQLMLYPKERTWAYLSKYSGMNK